MHEFFVNAFPQHDRKLSLNIYVVKVGTNKTTTIKLTKLWIFHTFRKSNEQTRSVPETIPFSLFVTNLVCGYFTKHRRTNSSLRLCLETNCATKNLGVVAPGLSCNRCGNGDAGIPFTARIV